MDAESMRMGSFRSRMRRVKGQEVQKFKGLEVQEFRSSKVQRFKGSKVQGLILLVQK